MNVTEHLAQYSLQVHRFEFLDRTPWSVKRCSCVITPFFTAARINCLQDVLSAAVDRRVAVSVTKINRRSGGGIGRALFSGRARTVARTATAASHAARSRGDHRTMLS